MKRKLGERDSSFIDNIHTVPVFKQEEPTSTHHSQYVKKKEKTASRTGTACDRCRVRAIPHHPVLQLQILGANMPQVRKMRCDDQPDGCASCRQANTECKTTDRITGKATVRGYVEGLEGRLAQLEDYNRQLKEQVLSLGQEPRPEPITQHHFLGQRDELSKGVPSNGQRGPQNNGVLDLGWSAKADEPRRASDLSLDGRVRLPKFRAGLSGNNYLGISSGNSLVNSVRGRSMHVLGMEIDLVDYMSPDVDEPDPSIIGPPIYNKSYRAFVETAFGTSPRLLHERDVQLPPREEGLNAADVYFRITNPFTPVVHKPTTMKLVMSTLFSIRVSLAYANVLSSNVCTIIRRSSVVWLR